MQKNTKVLKNLNLSFSVFDPFFQKFWPKKSNKSKKSKNPKKNQKSENNKTFKKIFLMAETCFPGENYYWVIFFGQKSK